MFKQVVKDELEEIIKEFNTGKYDTIMFPDGDGLFNTKISNITKKRTPKSSFFFEQILKFVHNF